MKTFSQFKSEVKPSNLRNLKVKNAVRDTMKWYNSTLRQGETPVTEYDVVRAAITAIDDKAYDEALGQFNKPFKLQDSDKVYLATLLLNYSVKHESMFAD